MIDDNYVQGPNRRFVDAENQDFQLRIRRKRMPVIVIIHISATAHFFANFREN